jgi:sulfoxide reductase catalytic subunit YedY
MIMKIDPSEITPEKLFNQRRQFIKSLGIGIGGFSLFNYANPLFAQLAKIPKISTLQDTNTEKLSAFEDIVSYNNYYEFGTGKADPAKYSQKFNTDDWKIRIDGEVNKPITLNMDDLFKLASVEERIYRLRCVEGWSMVIPWAGIPLSTLIKKANPNSNAKYVQFSSIHRPSEMIGQNSNVLEWPYKEGLRLDEAMHPLTLLAVGIYGKPLTNQNGAPIRLVVPWKYGFKSIKAIVNIKLTEKMPLTTWVQANTEEYGFFANVNPEVDHPRWSQATERRIGDGLFSRRRKTEMFNGYGDQVASLYQGMDLRKYF